MEVQTADGRTPSTRHRIVVGVDGSAASQNALRWALDEAARRESDLEVVAAWSFPYQWAEGFDTQFREDRQFFSDLATKEASDAVDVVLDGAPRPLWLDILAVEGGAAPVLLERARAAELLVVGSRGRGGFKDLLLGSVSTACVHHASCPTVVVPS